MESKLCDECGVDILHTHTLIFRKTKKHPKGGWEDYCCVCRSNYVTKATLLPPQQPCASEFLDRQKEYTPPAKRKAPVKKTKKGDLLLGSQKLLDSKMIGSLQFQQSQFQQLGSSQKFQQEPPTKKPLKRVYHIPKSLDFGVVDDIHYRITTWTDPTDPSTIIFRISGVDDSLRMYTHQEYIALTDYEKLSPERIATLLRKRFREGIRKMRQKDDYYDELGEEEDYLP